VTESGEYGSLHPGTWDIGEIKDCELPASEKEFMVCGYAALQAWAEAEEAEKNSKQDTDSLAKHAAISTKHQMRDLDSKIFTVHFNGSGSFWRCKKTSDGFECDEK
jgi:hypothetical protein